MNDVPMIVLEMVKCCFVIKINGINYQAKE